MGKKGNFQILVDDKQSTGKTKYTKTGNSNTNLQKVADGAIAT
jgi:hypothetical protein